MEKLKPYLMTSAAVAVAVLLLSLVFDPTRADVRRMDALQTLKLRDSPPPALTAVGDDAALLSGRPIFIMSTGAGAYKDKTFQVFGLSISPGRKAALVAIDGGQPSWISVGQVSDDVQLIDVTATSARFDTPLGERVVSINDTPAAQGAASSSSAGG
jgi:hypothetical protein